jgi:hypothetical protein
MVSVPTLLAAARRTHTLPHTYRPFQLEKLRGAYNQPITFLPNAKAALDQAMERWKGEDPLNTSLDWADLESQYLNERLVIIDDLFSQDALDELLRYTRTEANFRYGRCMYCILVFSSFHLMGRSFAWGGETACDGALVPIVHWHE